MKKTNLPSFKECEECGKDIPRPEQHYYFLRKFCGKVCQVANQKRTWWRDAQDRKSFPQSGTLT